MGAEDGLMKPSSTENDPPSVLKPTFQIDFSDPNSGNNHLYELLGGAEIKSGAPQECPSALRITGNGQRVKVPGTDISPAKMPNCSLVVAIYIESIVENSKGWVISNEDGSFDRAIVMHDERFGSFGICVGKPARFWKKDTLPTEDKWLHVVGVFCNGKKSYFYVDGLKAPYGHEEHHQTQGTPDLWIGQPQHQADHYSDCWIKEVTCYDFAMSEEQVEELYLAFDCTKPINPANIPKQIVSTAGRDGNGSVDAGNSTGANLDESNAAGIGSDTTEKKANEEHAKEQRLHESHAHSSFSLQGAKSGFCIISLCNVSSFFYLDGGDSEDAGEKVFLTRHQSDDEKNFHWELIPADNDTFNIRNISSSNYLNCRNPVDSNVQVLLTNANEPNRYDPLSNKFFQWKLIPFGGIFAVQSVSSGKFLDGRKSEKEEIPLFLSNRDPEGDMFLKWRIQETASHVSLEKNNANSNVISETVSSSLYLILSSSSCK